ncbi:YfhO family protein [Streptomyces sp. TRM76323]|uniref:YfhO family protein n=1 Tax=Streptomyces tamarix TaxID=3078565 RepID=A0ABU3QTF9_9ACTN|nr:YfhO family protein [Streptomyces tamarix]MDT9686024.1 YfhO family protein [Streptomyces tamarix]
MAESRTPPSAPRACGAAALLAVLAVCAGDAAARTFPFGPRTRAVNDLGNQFVPFHAHLWDLLHGRVGGGPLNWRSGYGTSLLPDLGTYLTSPFALLVGVFPRDRIDLAVYVVTVLKLGAAAAAMALALLRQRRGSRWGAAVLGAAYALCGWAVVEAAYNPMWLDGLIAFPLLCLVAAWVREGRRPVLGPVVVAVCWAANFYTAYMATLGAALVLLARGGARPRVLGRAVATVGLGVGLAAPVLVPVFLGSRHAYPGWTRHFDAAPWADVAARVLPATYSFFTPALFLGAGALLPAAVLPFHRGVARRERLVWSGLVAGVLLSAQWEPTHLVWHVFATPNGSPYRQTFVLAGVVVMAAWTAVAAGRPGWRALLGGVGVLAAVAVAAADSALVTGAAYALFAGGVAAAAGAVVLLGRAGRAGPAGPSVRGRRVVRAVGGALLAGAVVVPAAATTAYADRERPARLDHYPAWGGAHDARAAAVRAVDGWPAYRTDPGRPQLTGNDPLLVGGQGAAYYSSHTPQVWTRTLAALGGGWTSHGRGLQSLDNPVTDALFAVGARWRDGVLVRNGERLPLVTVRPGAGSDGRELRYGPSAFRNQELLLGSRVYDLPADGACPVGSDVFVWAPDFTGTARLGGTGRSVELRGGLPKRRAAMAPLGTQRAAGVRVQWRGRGAVPEGSVGCLDRGRLSEAVARLRTTAAVDVRVDGGGVRAVLPPGAHGVAVLAAPRIAGWRCGGRPAGEYLGLVAVDVPNVPDGSPVSCAFRPPGLRAGTVVGAAALLVLVGVVVRLRRARRPHATETSPVHHRAVSREPAGAA